MTLATQPSISAARNASKRDASAGTDPGITVGQEGSRLRGQTGLRWSRRADGEPPRTAGRLPAHPCHWHCAERDVALATAVMTHACATFTRGRSARGQSLRRARECVFRTIRENQVTPHVAQQNTSRRCSATDGGPTPSPWLHHQPARIRKRAEEVRLAERGGRFPPHALPRLGAHPVGRLPKWPPPTTWCAWPRLVDRPLAA